MIKAEILLDSYNEATADRLTTWKLTYPRFIHSEVMTHRVFSRNAPSSRAIPIRRMIDAIKENPATPEVWGSNQPGMQAGEVLNAHDTRMARQDWLNAAGDACFYANRLSAGGVHKQIANRVLEPFMHMTTIVSATDWLNFYRLRAHPEAQPEFQILAFMMLGIYLEAEPRVVIPGTWHIPFGDQMPEGIDTMGKVMISTARCARISYLNIDKVTTPDEDFGLHDRLAKNGHYSPFEHPAQAMAQHGRSGNFRGWTQYRELIAPEENVGEEELYHELREILAKKPG
jgi:thymidylate synthase ThyX